MTNAKSTKKALLMSAVSLFLCFAMLLGTTYAWFTDSVSSANNIITAGNLDIDLEYAKIVDGEVTAWAPVAGEDELFDPNALWEPGRVEVVYLKVSNLGSLALKYQLGVNVVEEKTATNMAGEEFKLSDHLVFTVVEMPDAMTTFATHEEAVAAAGTTKGLKDYNGKTTALEVAGVDYVALIVYMPETVGNEANYRGTAPSITLGVNLYATQQAAEKDSFDENYDKDAWVDGMKVYSAEDLVNVLNNGETNVVLMDNVAFDGDFVIPAAAASTYSMRTAPATVTVNLNGYTLSANDVTTEGSAVITNGTLKLPADCCAYATNGATLALENLKIVSDGISAYAAVAGTVNLKNVSFVNTATSNPIQNYGGTMNLENVTVAQAGDANTAWYSSAIQTINQIVKNDETGKYEITAQANTTINGGTYIGKKALMISAPGGNMTINGGTFEGSEYAIQDDFAPQNYTYGSDYESVITINGGTFVGAIKVSKATKVVVTGGTFSVDPSAYLAEGFAVRANNGMFEVYFPQESFAALLDNAQAGDVVEIPAGTYTFPANKLKEGMVLECAPGTVFTGVSGMNVKGATIIGATFDSTGNTNDQTGAGTGTINGTFKNCTFTGNHGLRYCYAGETVVFENCVFDANLRGIHFDGGANEVYFKNCEINGFNAIAGEVTKAVFEGCTFGNGNTRYNGLNLYCNTELIDCTFNFNTGKTNFIDMEGTGKTLTITDCTATLDGAPANVIDFVGGSKLAQNTFIYNGAIVVSSSEALQAAVNGGISNIVLAAGEYDVDLYVVSANRNLTITGQGAATKLNFKKGQVRLEQFDSLTISNCTIGRMVDKSWGQLVFASSTQAGGVYTLSNCTFDGVGTQGIYINQSVAATFNIENCTFNGDFGSEGAITVQNNNGGDFTVNVTDCTFENIPETSHEIFVLYAYNGWTLNAEGVTAYWKALQ